jgi:hypothetical protein
VPRGRRSVCGHAGHAHVKGHGDRYGRDRQWEPRDRPPGPPVPGRPAGLDRPLASRTSGPVASSGFSQRHGHRDRVPRSSVPGIPSSLARRVKSANIEASLSSPACSMTSISLRTRCSRAGTLTVPVAAGRRGPARPTAALPAPLARSRRSASPPRTARPATLRTRRETPPRRPASQDRPAGRGHTWKAGRVIAEQPAHLGTRQAAELAADAGAVPVGRMRVTGPVGERVVAAVDGDPADHLALAAHRPRGRRLSGHDGCFFPVAARGSR